MNTKLTFSPRVNVQHLYSVHTNTCDAFIAIQHTQRSFIQPRECDAGGQSQRNPDTRGLLGSNKDPVVRGHPLSGPW